MDDLDQELGRWQEAIRELLIELSGASDSEIDGGGCDSGDPLDFTLTEIRQAFACVEERRAAAQPSPFDDTDSMRGEKDES